MLISNTRPEVDYKTSGKEGGIISYKDAAGSFRWAKVLGKTNGNLKVRALFPNMTGKCDIKGPRFEVHPNCVFGPEVVLNTKGAMTKAAVVQARVYFRKFGGLSNSELIPKN